MKAERYRRIDSIFQDAIERPRDQRSAFLDEACADDATLRAEVEALIESYEQAGSFIESPVFERAAELIAGTQVSSVVGKAFGNYHIISQLGSGGMGEVFLAEDSRLGRKVALKLLAPDLIADAQAQARFLREARLASALDHPNICTIHEVGQTGGRYFIAMQLVEGSTLKKVIGGKPLGIDAGLSIALQVGDALALAHGQDIIHRDIKSHNIIITPRGQAKILDFGLAKLLEAGGASSEEDLTKTGMPVGTPSYMSPEQARGERADHRSDIFSFGVVLYEMVTGRTPFKEKSPAETMNAVINSPHTPITSLNKNAPAELSAIIDCALTKDKRDRYQAMSEMMNDLREVAAKYSLARSGSGTPDGVIVPYVAPSRKSLLSQARGFFKARGAKTSVRRAAIVVLIIAVIAAAAGYWLYRRGVERARAEQVAWAKGQIPVIEELAQARRFFDAFDLAMKVLPDLPDDPTIARLMPTVSNTLTVETEPAGAQVFLKRFVPDEDGDFPARELIGTTPVDKRMIARGDYVISIEKPGYATTERTLSGGFRTHPMAGPMPIPPVGVKVSLIESSRVADRMVFVPGGDYRLVAWRRPTDARVPLGGFLIDRYEVTNREYKEFVSAGGYLKQEYWKYPFIEGGKTLTWEEAMARFKDRTGLAGPRIWSSQDYPEGKAEHPVTDISWYEAAAYAEFRGKRLPTIFEWEKAARNGEASFAGLTMPWGMLAEAVQYRANFNGNGTAPVEGFEFGMSAHGCYNMAGNVSEWLLNETTEGFMTGGGSWEDQPYIFGYYGTYPGFHSSNKIGFRCASSLPGNAGDQGAMKIAIDDEVPTYTPASEQVVKSWLKYYDYEKTPLEAQVVDVKETAEWRREKIIYNGARGERAIAYLYLPVNAQRPLQVVHILPPGSLSNRATTLPDLIESTFDSIIKSGRAIFGVILKGYTERDRPAGYMEPSPNTVEFLEESASDIIDFRRGLDYLESRADIDVTRVAYFGTSATGSKLILAAVEARYRSVVLSGSSVREYQMQWKPEVNSINFVPYIRAHKLMIHGRYDEAAPLKTEAEPLFKLMRGSKRLTLFDGGHIPGPETLLPALNEFLDQTMGPVKR